MDAFTAKLILSFFIGGAYIAFTIRVAERLGSRLGGIVLGLPSTTLVSIIFIGWTQGEAAVVSATPILPVAIAISSLFPGVFVRLHGRGLPAAFSGALLAWAAVSVPIAVIGIKDIWLSLVLAAAVYVVAFRLLEGVRPRRLERMRFSIQEFLLRAGFSGSVVALAVLLAKTLGPLWGGLFSAFPAAFSSSTVLLAHRHGLEFASSVAKAMPLGSMTSVAFAVALYMLVPALGLAAGILGAFACSVAAAAIIYFNSKD
ncbi:MAG: DUF3147 family protein [Candidatus Micrarchaeota archaeon]